MNLARDKRLRLRQGWQGADPVVAVGAHDAMSAQLVDSFGFDAVWVSGFGVSTMTHALPDLNLVTMTEALAAAVRIDTATNLPVIADCDNGFGGLNNVVRTVREYERAGIAAISIEDNLFPKRNSLLAGTVKRELLPATEQARRIAAAKAAQETDEFALIARIESFIAGHGLDDACARADAYVEAGADAILMHSKDKTLGEIESFLATWKGLGSVPLVAVPTLFPSFTAEELRAKGFNLIIFANQLMRASVRAMEETLEILAGARNLEAAEDRIAGIEHVFDLVGTRGAIEAEDAPYVPPGEAGAAR